MAQEIITLSKLGKTWIFDLDGTLVKHNGYKTGKDSLLPGVKDLFESIAEHDFILILTARKKEYREITESFLKENGIRYNGIVFETPAGERILFNDSKPSGLETARKVECVRDAGVEHIKIIIDENL
jgi:hypothetical protein